MSFLREKGSPQRGLALLRYAMSRLRHEDGEGIRQVDKMISIAKEEKPLEAEYLELLARTGIRRSEMYKLKWNDILENQIILRQAKSDGTDQTIPNWPQFKETLTNIHNQSDPVIDYVWSDGNGHRLKLETITDLVQRYLKKIGVKEKGIGAHVLRHSFTTINLERGVPMEKISILLLYSVFLPERFFLIH